MKLYQRLIAGVTALVMVGSLASCNKKEEQEIPYTLEEVLSYYKDETNIDEILNFDYYQDEELEKTPFIDQLNQLESYMNIIDKISALGIEAEKSNNEDLADKYSNLTIEDVEVLIDTYNDEKSSDVEKLREKAGLAHINSVYRDWVKSNGLEISEELLKRVVKAAACEVSGLEDEYYDECKISKSDKKDGHVPAGIVTVNDPQSEESIVYDIDRKNFISINDADDANAYANAVTLLFEIQRTDDLRYDSISNYTKKAIESAKIAVAAGVVLDDGTIESENKATDAKQKVLTMYTETPTTSITETTTM